MMKLLEVFGKPSRPAQILIALVTVFLVGVLDYITGPEFAFAIFYLLPILAVSWTAGLKAGIIISVASATAWLMADLAWHIPYAHPVTPYWNAGMRGGIFLISSFLLSRYRQLNQTLEDQVKDKTAALAGESSERERTEEELHRAEMRFHALAENSLAGVYIIEGGAFRYVNPAMANIFGYHRSELVGKVQVLELAHPEDQGLVAENIRRRIDGEVQFSRYTFRGVHKSGAVIHCEVFGGVIEIDGRPAIIGTLLDMTERVLADEMLQASERRHRALIENSQDVIALVDGDGTVLYDSPSITHVLGYAPHERIGRSISEFVHPDERQTFTQRFTAFVQQPGAVMESQTRVRHMDGSWRWIEAVRSNLIADPSIQAIIVNYRDVTERVRGEEALRASEERFRAVAQSALDAIVATNYQGKIVFWNQGAQAQFGYVQDEVLGQDVMLIMPDRYKDDHRRGMERLLASGEARQLGRQLRLHGLRKNGSEFPLELVLSAWQAGGETFFSGILRDITERITGEQALRESEEKFRTLAEKSPNMIFINQGSRIIYANEACEQVMGYSREEFYAPYFDFRSLIAPETVDALMRNFKRHSLGQEVPQEEYQLLTKDGRRIDAIYSTRLFNVGGEPALLGIITDVTERRRAEQQIRKLSRAVEQTASMVIITDTQGNVEYVNPKFSEVTGHALDDVAGKNINLLQSDKTPRATIREMWETINAGKEWKGLFRNKRKQGELYWASATISPLYDQEGSLTNYVSIQEDITDRVKAEERLREQAEDLALLNSLHEAINRGLSLEEIARRLTQEIKRSFSCETCTLYLLNENRDSLILVALDFPPETLGKIEGLIGGRIPDVSIPLTPESPYREILGGGKPQLLRDPEAIRRMIAENTPSAALKRLVPAVASMMKIASMINVPLVVEDVSVGLLTVTGSQDYGERDLERLHTLAGPLGSAIMRKRTEDKIRELAEALEQRVIERTADLEAANKELEAFSYSVSHDLRAPLRAIDGFSRILQEDHAQSLAPEARRYVQLVREGTQRMGTLIDDLLAFSRLTRQPLTRQVVDPAAIIREVLEELQSEREGRRIKLEVGDMPAVEGDPSLLVEVFTNLIGNALKFTRTRKKAVIEIGAEEQGGEIVFFVRDNGVGFDMQYADKLFGVFQRLHRAEDFEGTGVGLAIVQRILHRHGGRIWVQAQPERGATFFFTVGGGSSND